MKSFLDFIKEKTQKPSECFTNAAAYLIQLKKNNSDLSYGKDVTFSKRLVDRLDDDIRDILDLPENVGISPAKGLNVLQQLGHFKSYHFVPKRNLPEVLKNDFVTATIGVFGKSKIKSVGNYKYRYTPPKGQRSNPGFHQICIIDYTPDGYYCLDPAYKINKQRYYIPIEDIDIIKFCYRIEV